MAASSPGLQFTSLEETSDVLTDQEADISYLTVGFWRRSAKPGPLSFLVLHSRKAFVLLSEEPWKGQQVLFAPDSKRFDFPHWHAQVAPSSSVLCWHRKLQCIV